MFSNTFIKIGKSCFSNYGYFLSISCRQKATLAKGEIEAFQEVLPSILQTLVETPHIAKIAAARPWITKMMEYNLPGGKMERGLCTVHTYEMLEKPDNVTDDTMKLARIMGWCAEMLQVSLQIVDDIMDSAITRRGKQCWYKQPDVGLNVMNDSIFMFSSIYTILQHHFEDKTYYVDALHCFNETVLFSTMGQHLDLTLSQQSKRNNYSGFTMSQYETIAKLKMHHAFRLPVFLGLLMADKRDPDVWTKMDQACMDLGLYYQIQDDVMDCFGDVDQSGKIGTDIREGKCSWLAATALERCSAAQRSVFTACYGSADPADVQRVKQLYEELRMPELFANKERNIHNKFSRNINQLPDPMAPKLLMKLFDMTHKRASTSKNMRTHLK